MAWTEIDLSTVVADYGSAVYADGVLSVTASSVFHFGDNLELNFDQWVRIEIGFSPTSHRTLRLNSALVDGSSTEYNTFINVVDYQYMERIGDAIQYSLGPDNLQWYAGSPERWLSFEAWTSGNTGLAEQITYIRWMPDTGPLTHRPYVYEEWDLPCVTVSQGQALPNAQAVIPSADALSVNDGVLVDMPFKVSGGSSQSPQLACLFPSAPTIPVQFGALAEVRMVAVARSKTGNLVDLSADGHGNFTGTPYFAASLPPWAGFVPASYFPEAFAESLSWPLNITPDDVRAGRFGYPVSGGRRISVAMNNVETTPVLGDGLDVDYFALRFRLVGYPPITGAMKSARRIFP